jgi:acetyl esterase/lipase
MKPRHFPLGSSAILAFAILCSGRLIQADPAETPGGKVLQDLAYRTHVGRTPYQEGRCKLDLHLPAHAQGFATLVWFHGGGLKQGDKREGHDIASSLAGEGLAVANVNYRLSPRVTYPAYLEDAAAAVAWVHVHIAEHGGDPARVFVAGHSAGAWLTLMIGLDARYLGAFDLAPSDLAGLIPVSGQTMTHFTVREERGVGRWTITADEAAPVFHGQKQTPPMLLIYADNDLAARAEENEYFVALMQGAGNEQVSGLLVKDRDHGSVAFRIAEPSDPARLAILSFIEAQGGVR